MKSPFSFKSVIKKMSIGALGCGILAFVVTPAANYFSLKHTGSVEVDPDYEHVFKGTRALEANSYTLDGFTYSSNLGYLVNNDNNTACVYIETMTGTSSSLDDVVIPQTYSDGTTDYSIIAIDYSGFANYEYLQSITFQNASLITIMDSQAFASCPNLKRFNSATDGYFVIPSNLTSISSACFMNDLSMTNLSFGSNKITEIKDNAFNNCRYLANNILFNVGTTLTIGDSAFANCKALPNLILPANVTSVGAYAFYNCTSIDMLFIPQSVLTIGENAFRLDSNATAYIGYDTKYPSGTGISWPSDGNDSSSTYGDWNYASNEKEIPVNTGYANINIDPDSIYYYTFTWDTDYLFYRVNIIKYVGKNIATINIPQTLPISGDGTHTSSIATTSGQQLGVVVEIGTKAFDTDTTITSVTVPNTVESIDSQAFNAVTKIATLNLGDKNATNSDNSYYPNGDTFIAYGESTKTFAMNTFNLTGLTSIEYAAFGNDFNDASSHVTSITIPSTVVTIGSSAFFQAYYVESLIFNGASTNSASLSVIGDNAFKLLGSKVTTPSIDLVIPGTITDIGNDAFGEASVLKSLTINDKPTGGTNAATIGTLAFAGCTNLKYVVIGNSVSTIADKAFGLKETLVTQEGGKTSTQYGDGCENVDWVYLASSVTSITNKLIYKNVSEIQKSNLVTIYLQSSTVPTNFSSTWNKSPDLRLVYGGSDSGGGSSIKINTNVTLSYNYVYYTGVSKIVSVNDDNRNSTISGLSNNTLVNDTSKGIQLLYLSSSSGFTITNRLDYLNALALDVSSYNITSIGESAFAYSGITSFIVAENLLTINKYAFARCTSLNRFSVASNSYVFPTTITTIGDYAFVRCSSLVSVIIGSNVTDLGIYTFYLNYSMTSLTISDSNAYYKSDTNMPAVYKRTEANGTYYNLEYITGTSGTTTYTILSNTISIQAFSVARTVITVLTIPNEVERIEDNGLAGSPGGNDFTNYTITTISFASRTQSKLKFIGYYGIGYQKVLGSSSSNYLKLPNNPNVALIQISLFAFRCDKKLYSVDFPSNGTTKVDDEATNTDTYYTLAGYMFDQCDNLQTITIPNSITKISQVCFWGCKKLTSATFEATRFIGWQAFQDCTALTTLTFPTTIETIDYQAFIGCNKVTSISFSGCTKLTKIGYNGFTNCTSLTSISFKDCSSLVFLGNNCFEGDTSITTVSFENCEKLTFINDSNVEVGSTFINNTSLTSVNFNGCKALTKIPNNMFNGCSALTYVNLANCGSLKTIGNYSFKGTKIANIYSDSTNTTTGINLKSTTTTTTTNGVTTTVTTGVTSIGEYAFQSSSLTGIDLSGSRITSIGRTAFDSCTSLTSATLPSGITTISQECFNNDSKLATFTIPVGTQNAITNIGNKAFTSTALTTFDFRNYTALTKINDDAFSYCTKLTSINLSNLTNLKTIGKRTFAYCDLLATVNLTSCSGLTTIDNYAFTSNPKLTTLILSNNTSLKTIGDYAFKQCVKLVETTANSSVFSLPNSVTSLGASAFNGCTALLEFNMDYTNSKLTTIGASCFESCTALKQSTSTLFNNQPMFYIPKTVTTINGGAFKNCSALVYMYISTNVKSVGDPMPFENDTSLMIIIEYVDDSNTTNGFYHWYGNGSLSSYWNSNSIYTSSTHNNSTKVKFYFWFDYTGHTSLTPAEINNITDGYVAGYWHGTYDNIVIYPTT